MFDLHSELSKDDRKNLDGIIMKTHKKTQHISSQTLIKFEMKNKLIKFVSVSNNFKLLALG